MNFLERFLSTMDVKIKEGPLKIFHPFYAALNTMLFTPGHGTQQGPHIRDSIDMKRFMGIVIFALIPSILVGSYNIGLQAGISGVVAAFMFGFLKLLPIIVVTYAVGLGWEMIFGYINGHDIHEGFLVTGILLPLTLPPTIPLWQVAVAVSFGTVIARSIPSKDYLAVIIARVSLHQPEVINIGRRYGIGRGRFVGNKDHAFAVPDSRGINH